MFFNYLKKKNFGILWQFKRNKKVVIVTINFRVVTVILCVLLLFTYRYILFCVVIIRRISGDPKGAKVLISEH